MSSPAFFVGADRGDQDLSGAEHLAEDLSATLGSTLGSPVVVCTQQVRTGSPHYAVSLEYVAVGALGDVRLDPEIALAVWDGRTVGADVWATGAREALTAHRDRTGGRAIRFPGQAMVTGEVPLDDVIGSSGIDDVQILGGASPPGLVLHTRGYLRPTYLAGRLTLLVRPAGEGAVIPFEIADPHRCCGGH